MDEFIARANIERYRAQLEAASDTTQLATLRHLLKKEEEHLSNILAREEAAFADDYPVDPMPARGILGKASNRREA